MPGRLVAERSLIEWMGVHPDDAGERHIEPPVFTISNKGGSPVRIHSAKSSCGCAPPSVSANIIPAGGQATIRVDPTPIDTGERDVLITIETDSPITPNLELQLRLIGIRKPPYLLKVNGDLNFRWEDDSSDVLREFFVETVEPIGLSDTPAITCDLSFLHFGKPVIDEFPHHGGPNLIIRQYKVPAKLTPSSTSPFVGEVIVTDPWDPSHALTLRVQGQAIPPLSVIPRRIIVRADGSSPSTRFFVKTRKMRPNVHLMDSASGPPPLIISPAEMNRSEGLHAYDIRLIQDVPIKEKIYRIRAGIDSSPPHEITIPVLVEENAGGTK